MSLCVGGGIRTCVRACLCVKMCVHACLLKIIIISKARILEKPSALYKEHDGSSACMSKNQKKNQIKTQAYINHSSSVCSCTPPSACRRSAPSSSPCHLHATLNTVCSC